MNMENRIRERLDLQRTMKEQLQWKEDKKNAERQEEEEFRQQVRGLDCAQFLNLDVFTFFEMSL